MIADMYNTSTQCGDLIEISSPAKLNLHLEIGAVRGDGFHEIRSLFQMVSLYDTITIRSLKDTSSCTLTGDFSCPPERNLVTRAVDLFRTKCGIGCGFDVDVVKRIPEGAGLGGGSSNAASVLIALDRLCGTGLGRAELALLGSELGSDVPFFFTAPLAYVSGRGERVAPLPNPKRMDLLLIIPDFSVPTAEAYRWFDREGESRAPMEDAVLRYAESPDTWPFYNAFTPVLAGRYPTIGRCIEALHDAGAQFAEMSGSGSAIFGVFSDQSAAERGLSACRRLTGLKHLQKIETLDRFPDSILQ